MELASITTGRCYQIETGNRRRAAGQWSQGDVATGIRPGRHGQGDATKAERPGRYGQGGAAMAIRPGRYGHGDMGRAIRTGRYGQGGATRAMRPGRRGQGDATRAVLPWRCSQGNAARVVWPGRCGQGGAASTRDGPGLSWLAGFYANFAIDDAEPYKKYRSAFRAGYMPQRQSATDRWSETCRRSTRTNSARQVFM